MLQLRTVNKALKAVDPLLELERGEGYMYFIYDDGGQFYETESVMTMRINDFSLERWLDYGGDFAERMQAKKADQVERSNGPIKVAGFSNPTTFRLKESSDA